MNNKLLYLVIGIFVVSSFVTIQAQEAPPPLPPDERSASFLLQQEPVPQISPLTELQEKEALELAAQLDPEMAEHLKDMKVERPERYRREITRILRENSRLERLKKKNPERYEHVFKIRTMETKSQLLGRNYREANESEQANIKSKLMSLLSELFDLRNLDRQEEVKRLEKQLEQLKQSLDAREKNKEQIIERRLLELIGESRFLEW